MDVNKLEKQLVESNYNAVKTNFIVTGFRYGFDIGYVGPEKRQQTARNLPFRCGNKQVLWYKMIKEVKLKRFAGPYKKLPFKYFIQSPVGLVHRQSATDPVLDNGDGSLDIQMEDDGYEELTIEQQSEKVCLIFHLSHPRGTSLNDYTPSELCSVKYKDFKNTVRMCLKSGKGSYMAKSDMKSAIRNLPIRPRD